MKAQHWATLIIVALVLIVGGSSLFTVQQTDEALITQFGKPIRIVTRPGLHVKLPFVQSVISFDRRLLDYSLPSEEVILGDQQRLMVDGFARFRITNPLQYYQAVGPSEQGIRARLSSILASSFRRVLGNETLPNVLSTARNRIMTTIKGEVNDEMKSFGVTIQDVRIRRADLPQENVEAVLQRMKSERERVAALVRADGEQAATVIRANADRERTVLIADANAKAAALVGEGEATATTTLANAFDEDPQFFKVWRTLEAYRHSLASNHTELVLSPSSPLLEYLEKAPTFDPSAAAAGKHPASGAKAKAATGAPAP